MKYLSSQLGFLFATGETRTNLTALARYFAFLAAMIVVYAVVFHLIMGSVEGQQHSWITGFYWTLVVMTTLGFGDITFTSDIGRLFSMVVLVSGVVFLLVMLPFLFIRLFYAPWLESRVRLRAPRQARAGTSGHVIITEYDAVAIGLVERLNAAGIPYFIVEPDAAKAKTTAGKPTNGCRPAGPAWSWRTARTRPTRTSRSPFVRSPPRCTSRRWCRKRIRSTSCS
jgi:voltage-gated potassium channel